jgi:hypothetical protein
MRFLYYGNELERSEVLLTNTPLLFAIEKEDPAMVLLLLSLGADPLVTGWTRFIIFKASKIKFFLISNLLSFFIFCRVFI